jgi:type IV pilus assembly protein PilV
MMKKINQKNGFYILEALVAILIFAIGILGVMQIQKFSVQAISDSQYRINALYLADSLIGDMWVDQNNISQYVNGSGTNYQSWLQELDSVLPNANQYPPKITLTNVNNSQQVNITIYWKDPQLNVVSQYQTTATIY